MRYLMTQTLLSSWAYTFKAFEGYEDEAMEDFIKTLKRERIEPNQAMLNGIAFETQCYSLAYGKQAKVEPKWRDGAEEIARILTGARVQVRAAADIKVDDTDFLLYGILDGLKAGVIYDVKFLNRSMSSAELAGKYLDSAQHPAYFRLIPEAYEFQYLVSDGKDLYIEKYSREATRPIEDIVREFMESIKSMGLLDLYKEHWQAK